MVPAVLLAAALNAAPPPSCAAADPAVTDVVAKRIGKRGGPDHYVITATVTNLGARDQAAGVAQHVELTQGARVLGLQPLPALGAQVAYKVAFVTDRARADRKRPLAVGVRYVLDRSDDRRNNCRADNDGLNKTF